MKVFVCILASLFSLGLTLQPSFADPNPNEIIKQVEQADDATIRAAGLEQAQEIRETPDALRAQGIEVSADEELEFNSAADELARSASRPDFKQNVVLAMKKARHGLARLAIDSGKIAGHAGEAVFWAGLAPMAFGTDFFTGAVLGRGAISTGTKNSTEESFGGLAGALTWGYTYTGLYAIGFTVYGPLMLSGLGTLIADGVVCNKVGSDDQTERAKYCHENEKIKRAIVGSSARAGEFLGRGIHRGVIDTVHGIEYPFRDKADRQMDDLGN